MRSLIILAFLFGAIVLFVSNVNAGCDDDSKDEDDSSVKAWFKNIGCKIQKGAEDLSDQAKPLAEKIGQGAKDFGSSVAQKYDEFRHKLTDDDTPSSAVTPTAHIIDAPTEKVPLAPLGGSAGIATQVPVQGAETGAGTAA